MTNRDYLGKTLTIFLLPTLVVIVFAFVIYDNHIKIKEKEEIKKNMYLSISTKYGIEVISVKNFEKIYQVDVEDIIKDKILEGKFSQYVITGKSGLPEYKIIYKSKAQDKKIIMEDK